jgi:hypothetical protein
VACRPLDWDLSAADALRLVRHDPHPVALLGAWADGSDIVASCPAATSDQPDTPFSTDLAEPTEACFGGGWIGYLATSSRPSATRRQCTPGRLSAHSNVADSRHALACKDFP